MPQAGDNETESRGLLDAKFLPKPSSLSKMLVVNKSIVCPNMFTNFTNAAYFTSIGIL